MSVDRYQYILWVFWGGEAAPKHPNFLVTGI